MSVNQSIIAGVYVISTNGAACVVDSVAQISEGEHPLITVSLNKKSYTNKMIEENHSFAISILPKDIDGKIISTFGFNSSRNIDKFEHIEYKEVDGLKVIDDSIGYMILEKVNTFDCDTHTLFIGRLVKQERFNDKEELVYQYYQRNKEEYLKLKVSDKKTVWVCTLCGYIHEDEELPNNFLCPLCGASSKLFQKENR